MDWSDNRAGCLDRILDEYQIFVKL